MRLLKTWHSLVLLGLGLMMGACNQAPVYCASAYEPKFVLSCATSQGDHLGSLSCDKFSDKCEAPRSYWGNDIICTGEEFVSESFWRPEDKPTKIEVKQDGCDYHSKVEWKR